MEIRFQWQTETIDQMKQESLEKEITERVRDHCEKCLGERPDCLEISLVDIHESQLLVKGSVFLCKDSNTEVMKITMDSGLLVQCEDRSFFKPGSILKKE